MAPLIILYLMLAWFDSIHTRFMLLRYGVDKEINPLIKWLVAKLGLTFGVWAGIAVPTLTILFLGINFRPLLEGVTLARLMLFFLQASRLRIELETSKSRKAMCQMR